MGDPSDMIEALRRGRERYESTDDVAALAESVRLGRAAFAQLTGVDALRGAAANELAASIGTLCEATGKTALLEESLALLDRALTLLPPGDPSLPAVYGNIAAGRVRRFFMQRNSSDLTVAIDAARKGVAARKPDDPNLAIGYSNLAGALRMRYNVTGDPAALDESIAAGRSAVAAIQDSTYGQPQILASLAESLNLRGVRTSSLADISEGVATARHAMILAPPASPWRRSASSILAQALRMNAQLTGELSSLSEAISLHRQNMDLVPRQHVEHAVHALQLAATLLVRYEWQEDAADLEAAEDAARQAVESGNTATAGEAWILRATCWRYRAQLLAAASDRVGAERAAAVAVKAAEKSLALTAPTARERSDCLLMACDALAERYEITGRRSHRARTVAAYRRAIRNLGADSATGQLAMLNLSRVFLRHKPDAPASQRDIAAAIGLFRQVQSVTAPGRLRWGYACLGLISAQARLFEAAPGEVDPGELEQLYQHVTEVSAILPAQRAMAGMAAADVLLRTQHADAAAWILADVVRLLPRIAWRGARRQTREYGLGAC